MKRLFAALFSCILITASLGAAVFADNIIGSHGGGNGVEDGVSEDAFPGDKNDLKGGYEGDINVKVNDVVHMYAVDITYTNPTYVLPTLTWDVNDLIYKTSGGNMTTTVDITITNYSDLPVVATAEVADTNKDDYLEFNFTTGTTQTVAAVIADATIKGTATTAKFSGALKSLDNAAIYNAVTYYTTGAGKDTATNVDGSVTIATYTITISKAATEEP